MFKPSHIQGLEIHPCFCFDCSPSAPPPLISPRAPHIVQSQLSEVAKCIVYCDFPEKWPGVLEAVYNNLNSQVGHRGVGTGA